MSVCNVSRGGGAVYDLMYMSKEFRDLHGLIVPSDLSYWAS